MTQSMQELLTTRPSTAAGGLLDRFGSAPVRALGGAAGGGSVLEQQNSQREARIAAIETEQGALEANTSKLGTVATQAGRGFLDAITAPGAIVGMVAESAGSALGVQGLEDFGRDLGQASSGAAAMEAAAFLFGGGGKHGLTTTERVTKTSEDQQKAWPALSTVSRVTGAIGAGLIGGAGVGAAKGATALGRVAFGASEGAAAGAQGGYERNEALRDVVSSALIGGALGGAGAAVGEGLSGVLKSKAYKAAARELTEDANLTAAGISRGQLGGVAGEAAGAVDAKATELAGALQDYRFQSGPLEGKPIMRMLRTPEDIASGVQQAARETGEALQGARAAIGEQVAANPQLAAVLEQQFAQGGAGNLDKMATQALEALGQDPAAYQALAKQAKSFEELAGLVQASSSKEGGVLDSLGTMASLGSIAQGFSAPHVVAAGLLTKVAQKAIQQRSASTVAALANTMVLDTVSSALERIIPSVEIAASSAAGAAGSKALGAPEREKRAPTLNPEQQQERYREQLEKVSEAVTAPDIEARTELIDNVGHLPAPLVIAAGADMAAKMAQLHIDMPKPTPNIRGKAYETLSSEQVKLANSMFEATTDPMSVFSDFAAGSVDYAKVQYAWKQYPGLKQAAQAGLMDIISQRLDDKKRGALPDGLLTQLDNLFGFDGKLQPTLDHGFAMRVDQLQPPQNNPPPKPGGSLKSPLAKPSFTERIAGG